MPGTNSGATTFRLIAGTGQNITATGTSQAFTKVGAQTYYVRLLAETANVRFEISQPAKAATASSPLLTTTSGVEYFNCSPGDVVTVIQDSAGGVLSLVECTH